MAGEKTYIYGRHALVEALKNAPKAIKKVFLAPQFADVELSDLIKKTGVSVTNIESGAPGGMNREDVRQGIIGLLATENLIKPYKGFIEHYKISPSSCLVLLDEIQDPHNVGAIIRSAAAFGVSGILIPEHNQAPVTGTVVKVSAGMAFRVPLISVGNVNSTLRDLKDLGFWIYGLEMNVEHNIVTEKFDAPSVFVMGNEAEGIRQKTRELCDIMLSIPMNPKCESLNVAASAAVTLYAWSLQHPEALQ
ncbi:MAG: 23S rRNA (guanosine(2251)-2'-O)-methyltransferase RlmB [Candidatus Vogelbacteria bacterium]|nr:23S rRNA (guanosine(2251)-2'-O)-methyltransferase RlmB [Candidatus Vogelbacteria bacterium]